MNGKAEKIFLYVLLFSQIILFGVMILFAIFITRKTSHVSREMLNNQALNISEEHMRERVENIIGYIESERTKAYNEVVSLGTTVFQNLYSVNEDRLEDALELWIPKVKEMKHGDLLQMLLYDKTKDQYTFYYDGKVDYNDYGVSNKEISSFIQTCPYYESLDFGNKVLYLISTQESLDRSAKKEIYDIVHISQYGEDGYVWVNEILNYEGGEDYAIRLIHPNLKETEGQYLSTSLQDAAGNYPYLSELEGIKNKGEIFHTYYFKNKSNDLISEKASYAKLYEPFHWIIATGDPLDDVLVYADNLESENKAYLSGTLMNTILILVVIFLGDVIIIVLNNNKLKEKAKLEERIASNEIIIKQADYETMTGLLRKVPGELRIKKYLESSSSKGGVLITLDLDDLKDINDTLGHKIGDEAIIGIADTLKSHFRKTDILIRSGGDEFVVFLPEVGKNIEAVKNNVGILIRKLAAISIGENKERSIHCSAGCSVVSLEESYESLFAKADKALYHVKRNGKNNFAFYKPEMEQEDFSFRKEKLLSGKDLHKFNYKELVNLLKSISDFYHLVMSVNVSKDIYYLVEEIDNGLLMNSSTEGSLSYFIESMINFVSPDQRESFQASFSREGLIKAYQKGKSHISYYFKLRNKDTYQMAEINIIFYIDDQGDICEFTMARWVDVEHLAEVFNK